MSEESRLKVLCVNCKTYVSVTSEIDAATVFECPTCEFQVIFEQVSEVEYDEKKGLVSEWTIKTSGEKEKDDLTEENKENPEIPDFDKQTATKGEGEKFYHYGSLLLSSSEYFKLFDLDHFVQDMRESIEIYLEKYPDTPVEFLRLGFSVTNMNAIDVNDFYEKYKTELFNKEKK